MDIFLTILFAWIILVILWNIFVLLVYFLAVAFRTPIIFKILVMLSMVLRVIIYILMSLILIYIGFELIANGYILFFIIYLFGGGYVFILVGANLIIVPFMALPIYLAEKLEDRATVKKVIVSHDLENDTKNIALKQEVDNDFMNMAKWFIKLYFLHVVYLFIVPFFGIHQTSLIEYIGQPLALILCITILIGMPYGIYCLIKHKGFLCKNKQLFFMRAWRFGFYLWAIVLILDLVIFWLFYI